MISIKGPEGKPTAHRGLWCALAVEVRVLGLWGVCTGRWGVVSGGADSQSPPCPSTLIHDDAFMNRLPVHVPVVQIPGQAEGRTPVPRRPQFCCGTGPTR